MDWILEPLRYEFMRTALLVSGIIGLVAGLLSAFVTLKGWSLLGDALSHAIVPGVAVAYALGLPFLAGAFVSALLATGAMAFLKANSRVREDAVIGVVFTAFFALGLLIISLTPAGIDRRTIVLGDLLHIPASEVRQVLAVSGVTMLVLWLKWRDLMLFCFDPSQARVLGLRAGALHLTLLLLLAAVAVSAMQATGAVLVVAMLITPGATALLLTDRFGRMLLLSGVIGCASAVAGTVVSYHFDGATGGCIVVLQTLAFLAAVFLAPKHGLVPAALRRRRTATVPG